MVCYVVTVFCISYVERVIDMWSQRGHIQHVGNKSCFRKVQNKYIA